MITRGPTYALILIFSLAVPSIIAAAPIASEEGAIVWSTLQWMGDAELGVMSEEDFAIQKRLIESQTLANKVRESLGDSDLIAGEVEAVTAYLQQGVRVTRGTAAKTIKVGFQDSDRALAVTLANIYAKETLKYRFEISVHEGMKSFEDLRMRADQQSTRVKELEAAIAAYKEKHSVTDLEQMEEKLKIELQLVHKDQVAAKAAFKQQMENKRTLVAAYEAGDDLSELDFIEAKEGSSR